MSHPVFEENFIVDRAIRMPSHVKHEDDAVSGVDKRQIPALGGCKWGVLSEVAQNASVSQV